MNQLTIKELEEWLFKQNSLSSEAEFNLRNDDRKGVQYLYQRWQRRQTKIQQEIDHYHLMMEYEQDLYDKGYQSIAGIDEAGRGPLAGPVVAGAVILKRDSKLYGINDSKQLSEAKREFFYQKIMNKAVAVGIGMASAQEIDEINIYQAANLAMQRAVSDLIHIPDFLLVDAMKLPLQLPQQSLIKGDAKSISIAAGSIIAKVTRDRLMKQYEQQYPGYGFAGHMGYPTKSHLVAIEQLGACPIHRQSFSPLKTV